MGGYATEGIKAITADPRVSFDVELKGWIDPRYGPVRHHGVSRQDEITTFAQVPLAAPESALGQHVSALVSPVFELFGGFRMELQGFEQTISEFFQRRF